MLKAEAVLLFSKMLLNYGVDYLQDVEKILGLSDFELAIKQIPGQTSGLSLRYFYMLTGSDDYVKPDRMIKRFLRSIIGRDPRDDECQQLITATAEILSRENKSVTPRLLDNLIWKYQRMQR